MPILSLSGALLLEKNDLQQTMKKISAGTDANQKINFHRPYM